MPGSPDSLAAMGRAVGDDHEFRGRGPDGGSGCGRAGGQEFREGLGGGAGVDQDAAGPVLRDEGQGGLGDPGLFRLPLDGAVEDAFLGGAEAVRGHGAAVDPADPAGGFEGGKVPADGFGGDAEALGEVRDAGPAAGGDELNDQLLAFLGEHWPSIASVLRALSAGPTSVIAIT